MPERTAGEPFTREDRAFVLQAIDRNLGYRLRDAVQHLLDAHDALLRRAEEAESYAGELRGALETIEDCLEQGNHDHGEPECPSCSGHEIAHKTLALTPPEALEQQLEREAQQESQPAHHYTSTACQHGIHDQCRRECKFCSASCACSCHKQEEGHR